MCQPLWAMTCADIFSTKQEVISERLSELPELRDMILQMLEDPLIPHNLKRILDIALIQEGTVVRELTESLRQELNIPKSFDAAHVSVNLPFRVKKNTVNSSQIAATGNLYRSIVDPLITFKKMVSSFLQGKRNTQANSSNSNISENEKLTKSISKTAITDRRMVFVQNRPISREVNDFITLVHELSHVRFNAFLEKHLEILIRKLPPDLISRAKDGVIEIHSDLYSFLAERYAFQTEFELLSATVGRYYPERYARYGSSLTKESYRAAISQTILNSYNITDPRIVSLKNYSIAQILLGVPF